MCHTLPGVERRRRAAVEDAVEVAPPEAREARVPVVGDRLDREHRDRVGPHQRVQPLAQPVRRQCVDRCRHGRSSPARARRRRCARRREPRPLAGHLLERFLERLLDRRAMVLPLPAHERPAVIFDGEPPARHGRIVPLGIGKPRSSSPASSLPRPARWT